MAKILTSNQNYYDIADTIRQMKDVNTTYKPREMAPALKDIYSNEVEGVLPLSFESNGMPLIDYRIDGASGGVGDLITDISDDNYGKYKVPVVVNGKNLFDETQVPDKSVSSESSNYQIFKQNGKLIVNGTTTSSQVDTEISKENGVNNQALDFINNNADNYIFTSSVPGRIMIRYKQNGSDVVRYTFNEYNSTNKIADRIVFRLQQNYQYDNEMMNIMFKLNKIQSTNYEPYHEPTTTTIYLDEPIEENESISLSDTEVDIPTIEGTNVLTIDTTVQPSNVYVQARKDPDEIVYLTQILEEEI